MASYHAPRPIKFAQLFFLLTCVFLVLGATTTSHPGSLTAAPPDPDVVTIPLRVETARYQIDAQGLRVEGYRQNDQPGEPSLPVWRTVVELPSTGQWEVRYETTQPQTITSLPFNRLPAVPVPVEDPIDLSEMLQGGELPAMVETVDRPAAAIYQRDTLFPASPLGTGVEQWQRGKRLLALTVFPFQYNPVRGTLRYHPDITVTVRVTGVEPGVARRGPHAQDEALTAISNPPARGQGVTNAVRVSTKERGMHRLTYEELVGTGLPVSELIPATFAVHSSGQPVAIQVLGEEDGRFDPGDQVLFYAEPHQGRFNVNNMYWFTVGGTGSPRMATRAAPQNDGIPPQTTVTQTTHLENNIQYITLLNRPFDGDLWFDQAIAPTNNSPSERTQTRTYSVALDDPVSTGSAQLELLVHGREDQFLNPDHALKVGLNGQTLGIHRWNGEIDFPINHSVAASQLTLVTSVVLTASLNDLEPGIYSFTVYPDWLDLSYPALADADGGERFYVEGVAAGTQRLRVGGFAPSASGGVRVYDVRDPQRPVQLTTTVVQPVGGGYSVDVWDAPLPNPTYYFSTSAALYSPVGLRLDNPSALQTPQQADYIAIVHDTLWDTPMGMLGVNELLAHRQAEGLRVAKVDVQDIYDEWSGGLVDPRAIQDFLRYAYYNWNPDEAPPEYVLLVGDGHYDYKNYLNTPLLNLIPPYLLNVDPFIGETATDNRYVSVDGPDDYLPDMSLGRMTAQIKLDPTRPADPPTYLSPAVDVDSQVRKIISYETTALGGAWQQRAVFVADNYADEAGDFHALSNHIRNNWMPPRYETVPVYYNSQQYPPAPGDPGANVRQGIRDAFNNDALMLQWFGHGSQTVWGKTRIYSHYDAEGYQGQPALAPNEQWPLTLSFACLSSSFHVATNWGSRNIWAALGESFVRASQRGSIADIGPTGLHVGSSLLLLNEGVTQAIFQNREARVGRARDAAFTYYFANSSAWLDLVDTTVLLGDPATRLRLPDSPFQSSTMTVSDPNPSPGETVGFSVAMVNGSAQPVADVSLVVDYDEEQLTIVLAPGAVDNGDTLTWSDGSLPPGTTTRSFITTVRPTVVPGTVIDTPAQIRASRENTYLHASVTVQAPPPTFTPTASATPPASTPTASAIPSPTPTLDPSITPSVTPTLDPSITPSVTRTATTIPSVTPQPSATLQPSATPSRTATTTRTPTLPPTATRTRVPTLTNTPTKPSASATPGASSTATRTPVGTATSVPASSRRVYLPLVAR